MVKGLSGLSSDRRIRGDLISACPIMNDDLGINMPYFSLSSRIDHLRRHSKKVLRKRSNRLCLEFCFSH